jgi:uncharacterized membrane protein YdjX (TVP38/TMEM64 family)
MPAAVQQTVKILVLAAIVLLVPIVPFVIVGELPGERWLSSTDRSALVFALTGSGLLTLDVVLPIPASIMIALLGGRLGFWPGWLCAWLGLTAGNLIGYGIGRLWPQKAAPDLPESPTLLLLILSRPVPILAEALAIAAGATRTHMWRMIAACAAGNAVYAGVLAADGAALLAPDWKGPGIILPLIVPVAGWLIWSWSRRKSSGVSAP